MIDRCSRPGCPQFRVSRSIDSRPPGKRWFCSGVCRDVMTLPLHWAPPGRPVVACGVMSTRFGDEHRFTEDTSKADCGNCKRSDAWKKAAA